MNVSTIELLKRATSGVVGYLSDTILFMVLYGVELAFSDHTAKGSGQAYARALNALWGIKEAAALRSLENLKSKGYVNYSAGKSDVTISKAGFDRLKRILPIYEKVRKWDGRIYLITYDVEEINRISRELLRRQIKKLGCGMLQRSVWITPYDPRNFLKDFIFENNLAGRVLISYLTKGSSLAGADIRELLAKVYHLDLLNHRYENFLNEPLDKWPKYKVVFEYYSILKDDPQLPFSLLPDNWRGDEAYRRVPTILKLRSQP